ncbi:MAG: excinuclease ABC subunit C, partial [Clostridia bacterium]|nr:excinuclease ABC subunit C [Clostridia bacterium]
DMERYAEELEFEKAAACRDRIRNIQKMGVTNTVTGGRLSDRDALAFATLGTRSCIALLSFVQGNLIDKKITFFDGLEQEDAPDAIESFIKQYYGIFRSAPKEILLLSELEDSESLEEYLSHLRGSKCVITVPQRGEKLRQVKLAESNAALELDTLARKEEHSGKLLELIGETMMLGKAPSRIEAYDISNTAGSEPVASMTVFHNGKPHKKAYKKFKIKTAIGGDDYGAMAEVIGRRLDRALSGDESFLPLPDVFLIDGGKGQTNVAIEQIKQRGLDIPVFGMVKDDHHRTRALVTGEGMEIGISATPPVFAFIGRIQEETHRFAIEFHRSRRSKDMRRSRLDGIPGLGPERRKKLLARFGTIKAIAAADVDDIADIVPRNVAENIKRKLGEDKNEDNQRPTEGQEA